MPTSPDALGQVPVIEPNLTAALRALDGTGYPWLLLRGEDDLARPAGDVDILIASELLSALDGLLEDAGFCRVLAPGHGSHRFYFCFSATLNAWVKLDIVSEIAFGPYQQWRTSLARDCLVRRVRNGPVWLPAPADQAWLQLLHLFLDKGEIAPPRMEAARKAAHAASTHDSIASYVDRSMGPGTAARVLELVQACRYDDVPAAAAAMASRWSPGGMAAPRLRAAMHRGLRLLGARLRHPGLVVGVMAPDGAGKTTLLYGLRSAVPLPTKYVYMGMWGAGPWDSWLGKVPGGRTAKKVYRALRGSLLVRSYSLMGRIVLMDRVPYDALLSSAGQGGALDQATNALALKVVRPPDLLLVLDVSGEVMFDRKGEHSPEILEGWRREYLKLAGQVSGSNILDAARAPESVLHQAAGIVWSRLSPALGAGPDRATGRGGAPTAHRAEATDVLSLHLWRLLDWRFLLPDLQNRRVGYGGSTGPEMEAALRLLDPSAAAIPLGHQEDNGRKYGVVLLTEPDLAVFRNALASVEPGGWICVEARRSLLGRSGPRTLRGWKSAFVRNGYQDVSVYWNVPSLERTVRIVSVESGAAIRHTLALHKDVRFGEAKAIAAGLAQILGLFDLAVPEGTVIGRRPPAEPL